MGNKHGTGYARSREETTNPIIEAPSEVREATSLRIVQFVTDENSLNLEMDQAVRQMSRKNHGVIVGRSLGSLALTLVSATEIGKMLQKKHGGRMRSRGEAVKIAKRLSKQTEKFMDLEFSKESDIKEYELYDRLRHALPSQLNEEGVFDDFSFDSELEEDDYEGRDKKQNKPKPSFMTDPSNTFEDRLAIRNQLDYGIFGKTQYKLPKKDVIQPFGKRRYAIDLDANPEIDKMRGLLQSFFSFEGYDIGLMNSEYRAHVTVAETFSHLTNAAELKLKGISFPDTVFFDKPVAESCGDSDILFA